MINDAALDALERGDCIAFVYDEAFIEYQLTLSRWVEVYEVPVEPIEQTPWAIGVRLEDLDAPLGQKLSAYLVRLHCEGIILGLRKTWGLGPSPFLRREPRRLGCQ